METDPSPASATHVHCGSVAGLWRYPVKSMMGEELNAAEVTAWRARSNSARAAWAASRARAASCPAFLARDSAAATRSSAARRAWAICARAASASCSAAALAVSAPASRASAYCAAARASPASASARARRRQNADPGRARSGGPDAPRSCRASTWRRRNAVSAVCGSPVTGSGSPQYPGSAP